VLGLLTLVARHVFTAAGQLSLIDVDPSGFTAFEQIIVVKAISGLRWRLKP
jgi:hypothetical protein